MRILPKYFCSICGRSAESMSSQCSRCGSRLIVASSALPLTTEEIETQRKNLYNAWYEENKNKGQGYR